ncbi:hypothetical protein B4Q13_20510, partial [Lacticaseibacillus rhamnosus]
FLAGGVEHGHGETPGKRPQNPFAHVEIRMDRQVEIRRQNRCEDHDERRAQPRPRYRLAQTEERNGPSRRSADQMNWHRLMWANDFPHSDSTWPWSQKFSNYRRASG